MSISTEVLHLLEKEPEVDGSDNFNIQTMLNENWNIIDAFAGRILTTRAKIFTGTYSGTGTFAVPNQTPTQDQINTIELPSGFHPAMLLIVNPYYALKTENGHAFLIRTENPTLWEGFRQSEDSNYNNVWHVDWAEDKVSWYVAGGNHLVQNAGPQMNVEGSTYVYLVIGGNNYVDA